MIQKTSQRQLNALMGTGNRTPSHSGSGPEEWGYWFRDRHYSLEAVQHPIRARMCGFGDKDRRPLAPAAVAKMIVRRRDNSIVEVDDIDYDFFVVTVDLWSPDGKEEMNLVLHPSASDRYLPSHLAKPRKRQASELAGVPGGPNNPLTLTARSSTRPSPYPPVGERTRPFSNHPPRARDSGGDDDPNPLLPSPSNTVPSSTQPSSSYQYSSSDPWSASTSSTASQSEQHTQWSYPPSHSTNTNNQSLTLPSIHSLDSTTFGANNQLVSSSSSSSSPVPFHISLGITLADLQNQYDMSPLAGSSADIAHITDDNHHSSVSSPFRSSWSDALFASSVPASTQNAAMHSSFSQLPHLSQLSSIDPWSPASPAHTHTPNTALSQVSSFHSYVQQQDSLSLPHQMVPSSPIPPTPTAMHPPPPPSHRDEDQTRRIPFNPPNSARERELNDAIANTTPRHTYTRTLVGPLSANAQRLQDEHRKPGVFFLFQDLSVRTEGTFRLRMRLMNVGVPPAPNGFANTMHTGVSPVLAQIFTEPFTVYSAKRFPGVPDTTALSIAFGNQGQKLPLRNRHASNKLPRRLGRPGCASSDEESS